MIADDFPGTLDRLALVVHEVSGVVATSVRLGGVPTHQLYDWILDLDQQVTIEEIDWVLGRSLGEIARRD